jgi:hypothetical protein
VLKVSADVGSVDILVIFALFLAIICIVLVILMLHKV